MKFTSACLVAWTLLLPVAAMAASPEDSYLAARDAYIRTFTARDKAGAFDDAAIEAHKRALLDLEGKLRAIVGPVELKGFPGPGTIKLTSLSTGDVDFGLVDGLVYASPDDKAKVLVTTPELLARWMHTNRSVWLTPGTVARGNDQAIKSEGFFAQAVGSDAAVFKYAKLPLVKPATASFAYAVLAAHSQDLGPQIPDEIMISVLQGDRAFVLSASVTAKIDPIPACDAVQQAVAAKADAAYAAYQASDLKNTKLFDRSTKLRDEGDEAYRGCFGEQAKRQGFFAEVVRQAQALVDVLPAR
jgi:hypothetical protein